MMRATIFLSLAFLAACGTGSAVIGDAPSLKGDGDGTGADGTGGDGTGTDGTGGDGTGGDGTGDDGGTTTTEPPPPWIGDWQGEAGLDIPEWSWEVCVGEGDLTIDEDGGISGEAYCEGTYGGGGGTIEYSVVVDGWVSADNLVEGTATVDGDYMPSGHPEDCELMGIIDGPTMELTWTYEFQSNYGDATVDGWWNADQK